MNWIPLTITITFFSLLSPCLKADKQPLSSGKQLVMTELWSSTGSDIAPISEVSRLRISPKGDIYVMDRKNHKIFVFSPEGELINAIGEKGEGPGESRMMLDFHLSPGRLILVDMNALLLLDHQGKFISSHRLPEQENIMPLFFLDDDQFVYAPRFPMEKVGKTKLNIYRISDGCTRTIVQRGGEGTEEKIPGMQGGRILVVGSGSYRDNEGILAASGPNGTLLWTYNGEPFLTMAEPNGRELVRFSAPEAKRRAISRKAKEDAVKRMRISINGGAPPKEILDRIANSISDQTTYYYTLGQGPSGRAAIAAYISEFGRQDGICFDLFSEKGVYIEQVEWQVPPGAELVSADPVFFGHRFYAVYQDQDGDIGLHAFRVSDPES